MRSRVAAFAPSLLLLAALAACTSGVGLKTAALDDTLPSWADNTAKTRILDFVAAVSDPGSPSFVARADRVAVFDHDSTLTVEKPYPVQFAFVYSRIRALAPAHPEWRTELPFAAVLEGDDDYLAGLGFREQLGLIDIAQGGIFQQEFDASVDTFLARGRHARYGRAYTDLAYRPMRELIDLLVEREFDVYIVSGGGIDFIRGLSRQMYGVPEGQVIGSSMKYDLRERDGELAIFRKPGFSGINVARFKPLNIQLHIGRRPILAVGNSDGDLQMLRYAANGEGPSLAVLLKHDDAQREYFYADDSPRVRALAPTNGWIEVSMRDDFLTVFGGD